MNEDNQSMMGEDDGSTMDDDSRSTVSEGRDTEALIKEEPFRRYVLYCLHLYTPPITLGDVAEQLTVWLENERAEEYRRRRLAVYNALYHDHLPRLCEAGLVRYIQREDLVEFGPVTDRYSDIIVDQLEAEFCELLRAERDAYDRPERADHSNRSPVGPP